MSNNDVQDKVLVLNSYCGKYARDYQSFHFRVDSSTKERVLKYLKSKYQYELDDVDEIDKIEFDGLSFDFFANDGEIYIEGEIEELL